MPTHTLQKVISYDDGSARASKTLTSTTTAGAYTRISESIPDGSVALEVTFELITTEAKMLMVTATGDITVKTNSSSTPDDTFPITNDNGLAWSLDELYALQTYPITADITTNLFVDNSSGSAVVLDIHYLYDPT